MEDYFKQIVTECLGCSHIDSKDYCTRYREPSKQWTRLDGCAMRTHRKTDQVASEKFVDPIKASKKSFKIIGGIK